MQADLLMGFVDNAKLAGKNSATSNTIKSSNENNSLKDVNFAEIVSELTEDVNGKIVNAEEVKKALKELIGDEIPQSMISELLPLIESLQKMIDHKNQKLNFDNFLSSFENMVNCEEQKTDLDTLLSALQKIMEPNSNSASSLEDNSIVNKKMTASSDNNPSVADILDDGRKNGCLHNLDKKFQKNGSITMQNNMPGSIPASSDSDAGNQKESLNNTVIAAEAESEFAGNQIGKSDGNKESLQNQRDEGKKVLPESFKGMMELDDIIEEDKNSFENKQQSNQNRNLTESKKNPSAVLDLDNPEILKNSEQKKANNFNSFDDSFYSKNSSATEENNSQKGRSLPPDTKIITSSESDFDNGGDSALRLGSDKLSSTAVEVKTSARPQQLNQADIIQQIVEKAKLSANKDHNEITIKLKPEVLGNIRLNISTENNHVTVKVIADSSTVKEILENNLHHLKSGFVNQGLEIGSFDVTVGDEPQHFYKGQNFSGFQRGRRHMSESKKFRLTDAEEDSEPIVSSSHRLETEKDRIDYYV